MVTSNAAFFISLLFVTLAAASAVDPCLTAHRQCKLQFRHYPKNRIPTFDIWTTPDYAFTTDIVPKDPWFKLGIVNSNNIVPEFINKDGSITPINTDTKAHPRFVATHFKPYTRPHGKSSGIGHQTFHGNQQNVATGRCIRVFFSELQKLEKHYPHHVKKNVTANKRDYMCVVFRTK